MTTKLLLRKLHLEGKEFITSAALKSYCNALNLDYNSVVRYFISRSYLLRIFRGIFYVKNLDELKLGKTKYSHLEMVSKGLELKGIKNWYFGLYTSLKLNNMTHEYFTIDYVINDKIFRAKPVGIAGYKFKFLKLKKCLFNFGVVGNKLKYSDPEKTVLDFIYVWRYNGVPRERILMDIAEYKNDLSKEKIKKYAENYPKTVSKILGEIF